jgi:hypothetical protein
MRIIGVLLPQLLDRRLNDSRIEFGILSNFSDLYRLIFEKKNCLNEGCLPFQF